MELERRRGAVTPCVLHHMSRSGAQGLGGRGLLIWPGITVIRAPLCEKSGLPRLPQVHYLLVLPTCLYVLERFHLRGLMSEENRCEVEVLPWDIP